MALPAAAVSVTHPSQIPHHFEYLSDRGHHAKLVFRVEDPTSHSPLIWTGHKDTSGYFSPNGNLLRLSSSAYRAIHGDKRGSVDWAQGPYMNQTIVDHIFRRWRSTALNTIGNPSVAEGEDIPEDDKSPWISTSRSLVWCVWEIARRLALAHSPPVDVVPDDPNGIDPHRSKADHPASTMESIVGTIHNDRAGTSSEYTVSLTIIRHHSGTIGLQEPKRAFLEAHIDPNGPLSRIDHRTISMNLQEQFKMARKQAAQSEEVLYYGRIFVENISSHLGWTAWEMPLDLPPYFFKATPPAPPNHSAASNSPPSPRSDTSNTLPGWLDTLVWDPKTDDYNEARRKLARRRRELEWYTSSRGGQGRGWGRGRG